MRLMICQLRERHNWVINTSAPVREVQALILDPHTAYNKAAMVFLNSSKQAVK
jgi:hypothetical protein